MGFGAIILKGINMNTIKLNQLKKSGEMFFKLKPDSNAVYILAGQSAWGGKELFSAYDRASKSFLCVNYENGNERLIKANKDVFVGFEY